MKSPLKLMGVLFVRGN